MIALLVSVFFLIFFGLAGVKKFRPGTEEMGMAAGFAISGIICLLFGAGEVIIRYLIP